MQSAFDPGILLRQRGMQNRSMDSNAIYGTAHEKNQTKIQRLI